MRRIIRIAVDARPLHFPGTGNARYLHMMLSNLIGRRPNYEWHLFSHRSLAAEYTDLLQSDSVSLQVDHGMLSRNGLLWLNTILPMRLRQNECSLFWATLAVLPVAYRLRSAVPAMVNFHDLNAFRAPETMDAWNRRQHQLLAGHTLRNAASVICLSDTTRHDIQEKFPGLPASRMKTVYPGCELPSQNSVEPEGAVAHIKDFFLCIGSIEPRKNHETLINAYIQAQEINNKLRPLVIAGRRGWGDARIYDGLKSGQWESKGIYFLENVSDAVLRRLYEKSACLCFPSLHEGFGLPVLEALQMRRPVLLSDIPIFREAAPEAIFVSPEDTRAWTAALIGSHEGLRKGSLRAAPFDAKLWSWENRSRDLGKIIDGLLGIETE